MSVQAGIWNLDGEPVNGESLTRISQSIVEYGPDGENTYLDGPVGMLYRPFHTTLESHIERQPHVSASGRVLTWDGRLDNRDELIAQLWKDATDDLTDVAIVAAAFDRWATDCFAKLVGDWALSIWNSRKKELILARDYIGVKHLFYYPKPRRVIWCNHLAPLALCGDQFTLYEEYIAGYLAGEPDADLTPYREIQSVPPGKFLQLHDGNRGIHTYWAFDTQLRTRYKTDTEYEEHYRHLFRQAVRRRLRTDSPVLADLSGGLDSSSIVCMADDILAKEGAETPRLDTFSLHDSSEPEADDACYFTKVEEKRGRLGFRVDLKKFGSSLSFEYPVFVASPTLGDRSDVKAALSDVVQRREYKVILSGYGGDEMNGQALDPRIQMADLLLDLRVGELAKQLTAWSLLIRKRPWIQLFFQTVVQVMPGSVRGWLTEMGKLEPWVNVEFARRYKISARQMESVKGMWFARPSVRDAVQTLATISRRISSMGPSLVEKRYPYLDQTLVEFLTTIPLDQLLRPGQRRFLMRRALTDVLPVQVLTRKTKAIFGHCHSAALEKHWEKVESAFSFPLSAHLGFVDTNRIREALLALKNGKSPLHVQRLLNALSLEFWLRNAGALGVISTGSAMAQKVGTGLVESGAYLPLERNENRLRRNQQL